MDGPFYTPCEILALARAYSAAVNRSFAVIGRRACGNYAFLYRLDQGLGCHSHTLARASAWFDDNWPDDVPWPLERRVSGEVAE